MGNGLLDKKSARAIRARWLRDIGREPPGVEKPKQGKRKRKKKRPESAETAPSVAKLGSMGLGAKSRPRRGR